MSGKSQRPSRLTVPPDRSLPFFAYGLLKPHAPAHLVIRDHVNSDRTTDASIAGRLYVRDGLPLIDPESGGLVEGKLLYFRSDHEDAAYDAICAFEPAKHYAWTQVALIDPPKYAWALAGVQPIDGSVAIDGSEWSPGRDGAFEHGMAEIGAVIGADAHATFGADSEGELGRMFRFQMAYLLLWTLIERYAFLRFGLQRAIEERVTMVGRDSRLREALTAAARDVPLNPMIFDKNVNEVRLLGSEDALKYFREVRHHLVHRGKGMPDAERLRLSLRILHEAMGSFLRQEDLLGFGSSRLI